MTVSGVPQSLDVARAGRNAGEKARDAAASPWLVRLARFGHVIRGILYFVPGALALKLALGRHGHNTTQAGSIDLIAQQPFGKGLLIVVAVGLAGYALWGVVRVVFDPLQRGHSPAGLAQRFGYATSAIAYSSLFVATVGYLTGALAHVAPARDWAVGLMRLPFGALFVGLIGACWILGSGIPQIVQGWRATFVRDLALERVSTNERRWAIRLGRVGVTARGVVFSIIGLLLISAALHRSPGGEGGLDGALVALARHSYGRLLLGAAGVGLMAFGTYSAMCARWMRMRSPGHAPLDSSPHIPIP